MSRGSASDSSLSAIALWILDLGVTAAEAREWAASNPQHPAASCLDLVDAIEALAL
jgi:hypothetical protein